MAVSLVAVHDACKEPVGDDLAALQRVRPRHELSAHLPAAVHVSVELSVDLGSLAQQILCHFHREDLLTDDDFETHHPLPDEV